MRHKFEIPTDADFDILMDVYEGNLVSIQDIPKKTPQNSRTSSVDAFCPVTSPADTVMTNVDTDEDDNRNKEANEVSDN